MTRVLSFARALYDLAEEINKVKEIYDQSRQLLELLQKEPDLIRLFQNETIPKEEKNKISHTLFDPYFEPIFCDFLRTVSDMHEFYSLRMILKKYLFIVEQLDHARFVKITSARPLSKEQMDKIKTIMEKKLNMHLIVHNRIDPDVIAGVKLESESTSFDSTIPGKLKAIKTDLRLRSNLGD